MSLDMNIIDWTIYPIFNWKFNGNTIHSLVVFSKVVPIRSIYTTKEYKIVRFSL